MILKYLSLWINPYDFDDELRNFFIYKSYSITQYIERNLKLAKFESSGFNHLSIKVCERPNTKVFVVPEKALNIEIPFIISDFKKAKAGYDLNKYFSKLIVEGIEKAKIHYSIPDENIFNLLIDFHKNHYQNEWLYQKKINKSKNLIAELHCKLTTDNFLLILKVLDKKEIILNKQVLKTLPSSFIYKPRFKNLVWNDNELIITNIDDKPIFKYNHAKERTK